MLWRADSHFCAIFFQHGLMLMTCVRCYYNSCSIKSDIPGFIRWVPKPVPDEICFEAIKAGVDMLPPGVKMLINSSKRRSHSCIPVIHGN